MKKKHLTEGQRYEKSALLQSGKSQKDIAEQLNFSKSTVSREISRNADGRKKSYNPDFSQREYRFTNQCCYKALLSIKYIRQTITVDNGKEFIFYGKGIAENSNIFIYFAKPYLSWKRDINENTNGLIKQFFPKDTDFGDITPEQVMRVQNILNSRPRKKLGYMTPKEKFKQFANLNYNTVALSA